MLNIYVQNIHHNSHEHMHSNDHATAHFCAQSLLQWWSGPAASTPSADVLTVQLIHIMDLRTVDPLLKDAPDAVVRQIQVRGQLGGHISGWMNSGVSLCSKVICLSSSVNGMISLTSTLRHQVRDVRDT